MTTLEELRAKRVEILRLVARHGASNVRVFGSVLRGEAGPDSDIDLLVEGLEHAAWGGGALLMELQELLEQRVRAQQLGHVLAERGVHHGQHQAPRQQPDGARDQAHPVRCHRPPEQRPVHLAPPFRTGARSAS